MQERFHQILSTLESNDKSGVTPRLLAVSKGQPATKIKTLYDMGQRDFGENYAAEMIEKMEVLAVSCPDICWHYIGKIQKRQAKGIVRADWVHSVGSEKEMNYLAKHVSEEHALKVLFQVNIAREPQKGGFLPEELDELLHTALPLEVLELKGLMCLPPFEHIERFGSTYFTQTRELREKLAAKWQLNLPELSMGMSGDYHLAIKEGATWVRIGTLLFGPRPPKQSME